MQLRWIPALLALSFGAGLVQAQVPSGPNAQLIGDLTKALNATPDQATGAAGAIFSAAKTKMNPSDWSKLSSSIPGVDQMMKMVPGGGDSAAGPSAGGAVPGAAGAAGAASAGAAGNAMGGLTGVSSAFSKLGLSPDQVSKAVPIVSNYVGKVAGPDVGKAFASALK
jgi:hypothetical protein